MRRSKTDAAYKQPHPMDSIRQVLWQYATRPIEGDTELDQDSFTEETATRMRAWALTVAAEISDCYTAMAKDGSLVARTVGAFRDSLHPDHEPDDEPLYELSDEVEAALRDIIHWEIFDEFVPCWAQARAAITSLRMAISIPSMYDLRSLAILLSTVPEHAALAAAYMAIQTGNEREGKDIEELRYFLTRRTDDRIDPMIESLRYKLGEKWLADLERRMLTGEGSEFDPPLGPSPSIERRPD